MKLLYCKKTVRSKSGRQQKKDGGETGAAGGRKKKAFPFRREGLCTYLKNGRISRRSTIILTRRESDQSLPR